MAVSRQQYADSLQAFSEFSDPSESITQLSDRIPILLFPLRLETRFKTTTSGQPQLWVRAYPDSCLIDSFEPSLTEQEVASVKAFWLAIWRAREVESLERAAWRHLVAAHGSGRAGWIVQKQAPLNPRDKPARNNPADVLLFIVTDRPLPPEARKFWREMWLAKDEKARRSALKRLTAAVGAPLAKQIAELHQPINFSEPPPDERVPASLKVEVVILRLRSLANIKTRRTSWSSAPRAELLPERLLLVASSKLGTRRSVLGRMIRTPLVTGPDPNASADQLKPVKDTDEPLRSRSKLQIPEDMAWMFDFEKALEVGMAFRIDLTATEASEGFARLVVLGVRLSDSPVEGAQNLTTLLEHQLHSRTGLEFIPQGTPTNNTEEGGSGFSFRDDSESTFDSLFKHSAPFPDASNQLTRCDGHWFSQALGVAPRFVEQIPNANGRDQSEARAMQIALWPGTLGYWMKTLLGQVFSRGAAAETRHFFTRYVSGRGPLPALRIGDQAYGILPTTAFDKVKWADGSSRGNFLNQVYQLVKEISTRWKPLVRQIDYVGKEGGDRHQRLLNVLGLHPTSVEYHSFGADSVLHRALEISIRTIDGGVAVVDLMPVDTPMRLLRDLGYSDNSTPDVLNRIYSGSPTLLSGPLIDDRPLSETEGLGGGNYIQALINAAKTGIEVLQTTWGLSDTEPVALLHGILRYALQLGFHETAVKLTGEAAWHHASLAEPPLIHINSDAQRSESRYAVLFAPNEAVTNSNSLMLGDYIAQNVTSVDPYLREHIEALNCLADLPTARLERLLAEHVDCLNYRLDAWKTGLLTHRLEELRKPKRPAEKPGLFLGAFGWVENLRPKNRELTPVNLPDDLERAVNNGNTTPLVRDSTNGGLIHAPSVNHATTAAVLRNGYIANDGRLAINLSSRRVRLALSMLEGIRNGQSLGALLGYQFERHLHDHGPAGIDAAVYPLRRAFPLTAYQIASVPKEAGGAREAISALNVVDGRKLIEHMEQEQKFTYPFGLSPLPAVGSKPTLPPLGPVSRVAINKAVQHIRAINDAVADLALAEGVHQAVVGNYARSAGTLEAFAKGNYPPEPAVIRTPRSGIALTLRTAIHFPVVTATDSLLLPTLPPLAIAEPAVNAWLANRLPPPENVGCQVTFHPLDGDEDTLFVTQKDLKLEPIELLYRVDADPNKGLSDLEDLIVRHLEIEVALRQDHPIALRHDRPIEIKHTERVAGRITWFELNALLGSLRSLLLTSRPLQPADLMRANDASRNQQNAVSLGKTRLDAPLEKLDQFLQDGADALSSKLDSANSIDDKLVAFASEVGTLAAFRLPQTGTGFAFDWRAGFYARLVEKINQRIKLWRDRLARYDALIVSYNGLPGTTPNAKRLSLLQAAEVIISTTLLPPNLTPQQLFDALAVKHAAFVSKLNALSDLVTKPKGTVTELLASARAQLPLTDFEREPLDFAEFDQEIDRFRDQLKEAVNLLKTDVAARVGRAKLLLGRLSSATAAEQVKLIQSAAKEIFGEDFVMVPQITLPPSAIDELVNAWKGSKNLTTFAEDPKGGARDFPIDDWLHGVARVRGKMRHWENAVFLWEAFQVGLTKASVSPHLTPLQLPYKAGDHWLALEFPLDYQIDSDRLLYTGSFDEKLDAPRAICGVLVDEWTEVIPGTEESTGIAFHYDRASCEAPQCWLLAMSPRSDGAWVWDDLLEAVNDSLDSAKGRAIEPDSIEQIGSGEFSWLLPATMSAYTVPEISISNNLLRNIIKG